MSPDLIDSLLRTGRWQSVSRGVYTVNSGRPSREAVLWTAFHRAGSGAALSHDTAAELFGLTARPSTLIHVTVGLDRRVKPISGVVIHYSGRIAQALHPTLLPPRTNLEETVLDLVHKAATFDSVFGVVSAACQRRLTTPARLADALAQRSKIRWRKELSEALGLVGTGVHSVLEYRYLHRVERPHNLPVADRQARVDADGRNRYLDNLYGNYQLCVELDGKESHPDERRWDDQRRANEIMQLGVAIMRYGWSDIDRQPCQTAAQIAVALRTRGWTGQIRRCGPFCQAS